MTILDISDLIDSAPIPSAHYFKFYTCGDADHLHVVLFDEHDEPFAQLTIGTVNVDSINTAADEHFSGRTLTSVLLPVPEWAARRAKDYFEVGAVLPTRDGRRCGNATVIALDPVNRLATVRTDAGTVFRLGRDDAAELFWPPDWIQADPNWSCRDADEKAGPLEITAFKVAE